MKKLFISLLASSLFYSVEAQTPTLVPTSFASGFSSPVGMEHCGDSRLFVVQQRGLIRILNADGTINASPFLNVTSLVNQSGNERGLLGLAFHPNYATNGYFYVNYTRTGDGATRVSRFSRDSADSSLALANSEFNILTIAQPYSNHNGGQIRFGPDGYLYIGMGDGGDGGDPDGNGQNRLSLLAKMLRIDVDGGSPYGIPASNPFYEMASTLNEIWAIGMRNPWRYSFDRCSKDLWIADVGQDLYEEIDIEPAGDPGGRNYGWSCYEASHAYNSGSECSPQSNFTFPIFEYPHTDIDGCSITGGFVYRGAQFGNLFGYYLFTDFCSGNIWGTIPDGSGGYTTTVLGTFLTNQYGSFGEDYLGELYLLGRTNGIIYKISTTECSPTAFIMGGNNDCKATSAGFCTGDSALLSAVSAGGFAYQWKLDGDNIDGATAATLYTTIPGTYTVFVTKSVGCSSTSAAFQITENPLPVVSFSGLSADYCNNENVATLLPTPTGGTFSGAGISGNNFDPATGNIGAMDIVYTYTDTNGCINSATQSTTVSVCTSIYEQTAITRLSLYPNPTRNSLNVEFIATEKFGVQINVCNTLGEVISTEDKTIEVGKQKLQVNVANLASGVYVLHLQSANGNVAKRFVVGN